MGHVAATLFTSADPRTISGLFIGERKEWLQQMAARGSGATFDRVEIQHLGRPGPACGHGRERYSARRLSDLTLAATGSEQ